jgi:tetratricopeptide (TPR) repeat protein
VTPLGVGVLGAGSLVALALLLVHAARNRGWRATLAYVATVTVYGALRGWAVRGVTEGHFAVPFPYLMQTPGPRFFGVTPQELVGWLVATTLAWVCAERLLRRLRLTPGVHATAAAAALGLAAVCLAVESAALAAGWWTWTLALPRFGPWRVPPVALMDWGFVAFDVLLPYLIWNRPGSPWSQRVLALTLFPLHMLGHTWVTPLAGLPLAGNDLVHVGIVAFVLWQALDEPAGAGLPAPQAERARGLPSAAGLLVAGVAGLAILRTQNATVALAALPLALMALAAAPLYWPPAAQSAARLPASTRRAGRLFVLSAAAAFLLGVRAPDNLRVQRFVTTLDEAVRLWNQGQAEAAEARLRAALALRPQHAGGRTLLAALLLRQGRRVEARAQLEAALETQPGVFDARLLLATLDLVEGHTAAGRAHAARAQALEPGRAEPVYLLAVARGALTGAHAPQAEAVALARQSGPQALAALRALALQFGDDATAAACALP